MTTYDLPMSLQWNVTFRDAPPPENKREQRASSEPTKRKAGAREQADRRYVA